MSNQFTAGLRSPKLITVLAVLMMVALVAACVAPAAQPGAATGGEAATAGEPTKIRIRVGRPAKGWNPSTMQLSPLKQPTPTLM
ncbi:MAG: hypothetical protein M3Q45_14740 [Chloroflexota bacterium]|nr:hypothetical protein [Chloroflexota bacterium]